MSATKFSKLRTEPVLKTPDHEPLEAPESGQHEAVSVSAATAVLVAGKSVPSADGHPSYFGGSLAEPPGSQKGGDDGGIIPGVFQVGPSESIDQGNLVDLIGHLNRHEEGEITQWASGLTVDVAFPQSLEDIPEFFRDFDDGQDEQFNIFAGEDYEFVPPSLQDRVMQALQTWADVADIHFELAGPGETPDLYIYGREFGGNVATAGGASSGIADQGSRIVLNTKFGWPSFAPGTGGWETVVHEGGHSLGLSHPGAYDGVVATSYLTDAEYIQDTKMYSVMSYFSGEYTGFEGNGNGLTSWLLTPRSHDMYVMHYLYGANWNTRIGDTTYGYNAEGVDASFDFTTYGGEVDVPQLTIWDAGGTDWLDLSGDGSGVTLDLRPGAFSSTHGMTYNISLPYVPGDAPDELAGYIENARGGDGNDKITGNVRDNVLIGGEGQDVLIGLSGDDDLRGGAGNDWLEGDGGVDTFNGGTGHDTVDYTYSSASWTVALAGDFDDPDDLGIWGSANAGGNSETIIDVEDVTMGSGDDHVTGSSRNNTLSGNEGNDTLIGLDGADTLYGGPGNDTLDGGLLADDLFGEDGNDTLIGGSEVDHLYGGLGNDTIDGGEYNDVIYGQDGNDTINGAQHNDTISGGDGDDTIAGGPGDDNLDGGDGVDTLDYTADFWDWTISLTFETATPSLGNAKSVRNFEAARMGFGDDYVRGTTGSNSLYGGGGRDQLFGIAGNDHLEGEAGDDRLNGGPGNDSLIGGAGFDIASYADDLAGVLVDLNLAGVQNTAGSGIDLLQSIEGLVGSQHDDWLIGNGQDNQLSGGLGQDQIFGGDGADILDGGDGNDNLLGGNGNDVLTGGKGSDWASYLFQTSSVLINLGTENAQNTLGAGLDTLISIENVLGTAYGDVLIGSTNANRLEGGAGNDVLTGIGGNDELIGGAGNDSLNGGVGNDLLDGGAGIDWALYNTGLAAGVAINLYNETQNTGGSGTDTLRGIENAMGTSFVDGLTGNDSANELRGEGGDDWIWGFGGNDIVNGGDGADAVAGGDGADHVIGGAGNDHLWGGTNADTFIFASGWGNDWIWDFQPGSDRIDLTAIGGLTSINQLDTTSTSDGALVSYNGQSILLLGVSPLSLHTYDFVV